MGASYQLAVLGDHLGGLAAAALAARRGARVLLLESAAGAVRPFELLNATSGGADAEPGLARLFQELGLAPFGPLGDDRIHFHALAPPLQLCLPRHRVSLHADRTARAWELQREFGEAPRALPELWKAEEQLRERSERGGAPAGGAETPLPLRLLSGVSSLVRLQALERKRARQGFPRFLDERGLGAELRAALAAQAQAVTRRPARDLTWADGLRALRTANGGLYRNAAGQSGVLVGLRASLVSTGGDIRPLVALEGIDVPRTGGLRLHLAAGGTVKAERAIVDLPLAEAVAALPEETARAAARKGLEERVERGYGLLEATLAPGRRPAGMGDFVVIAPEGPDPDAPGVLLALGGEADDGSCALEALAFFPPGEAPEGREGLLERVRTILPFFDESLAGEPRYRAGAAPSFARERLERRQREERLACGWRTGIFSHPPFTLLRNEEYASVGLAEGLVSGLVALG